ncbi:MAG: response regulator [Verrucomicrobia bacterium]|nr:response regulator [Verrucomicrobiota bacterium]
MNPNPAANPSVALQASPPASPTRILVVDDNEAIRAFLSHFFRLEELPVEMFSSPYAALERFLAAPQDYSMLLTDCEMPGMSGLELANRIRRARADLPMVLFSTSVTVLGPKQFLSAGFAAALPKPVALEKLRAAIRGVLDTDVSPASDTQPQLCTTPA